MDMNIGVGVKSDTVKFYNLNESINSKKQKTSKIQAQYRLDEFMKMRGDSLHFAAILSFKGVH
jgi:hypothetical protein